MAAKPVPKELVTNKQLAQQKTVLRNHLGNGDLTETFRTGLVRDYADVIAEMAKRKMRFQIDANVLSTRDMGMLREHLRIKGISLPAIPKQGTPRERPKALPKIPRRR